MYRLALAICVMFLQAIDCFAFGHRRIPQLNQCGIHHSQIVVLPTLNAVFLKLFVAREVWPSLEIVSNSNMGIYGSSWVRIEFITPMSDPGARDA